MLCIPGRSALGRRFMITNLSATVNRSRLKRWMLPVTSALLFASALWIMHHELEALHYRDVHSALAGLPAGHILLALLFTAANYLVLTGYDQLGFVYIGKRMAYRRIALASFVGYSISNSVGFSLLSGTSARYRFYARWCLRVDDFVRLVAFYSTTFWLGLLALGGWSLTFYPYPELGGGLDRIAVQIGGVVLLCCAALYLVLCAFRTTPLSLGAFELPLPRLGVAFWQLALSIADWALAAAIVYVLLPSNGPPYMLVLSAFLAAQLLGLVSHVPGGLGVFEGTMVLLLGTRIAPAELLSALLLYRGIYYLLPLALALAVLLVDEASLRRSQIARAGAAFSALSMRLAPGALAVITFLAGAVLLFSGATPADPERLRWLSHLLPIGVFEASHFLGSIVGVTLLIVARGVARRLNVAYHLAVAGLAAGIAASLLKAGDWEEALLLSFVLLAFLPSRRSFNRRAALMDIRFNPGWILAVICTVGASIWLGLFAFKHVEYADQLWWRFSLDHDVSRYLRASVGAAVTVLAFGIIRLLRPVPPPVAPPSKQDLDDAEAMIKSQDSTLPFLVFLGDKGVLFSQDRTAFLMYAVQGRTWVALGEPVGPPGAADECIRYFVDRATDSDGQAVFYQIGPDCLHRYADLGMAFLKLGEEARVRLDSFSLEGSARRGLRAVHNRIKREGVTFRVVPALEVPAMLPLLKNISDDWLTHKSASEKGFSLGRFDEGYIERFPVAIMERAGRVEAFANVLPGPTRVELSVDLMRYCDSAPKGIMDALFIQLLLWGREQGYQWFNLGMAPLSGIDALASSPVRLRLSHWVYRHGEAFYNFQGLRAFKEKFDPVWEPRYLAYQTGLALPRILTEIAALVAGGYTRIFR